MELPSGLCAEVGLLSPRLCLPSTWQEVTATWTQASGIKASPSQQLESNTGIVIIA